MMWKPLPRDPAYMVSQYGQVRGIFGKMLSRQIIKGGYLRVSLRGGKYLVHRLVLEAWVGPCPDGFEASHEDGIPYNNHHKNLKWKSKSSNCRLKTTHGTNFTRGRSILTWDDVRTIRRRVTDGETVSAVARDYPQVARSTVSQANSGRNWK